MISKTALNEKIVEVYKHKVFRNFSSLLLSNIAMQLFNMVAIVYVTKILVPVEYGLYTFMVIQAILIATIAEFGIKNVAIREIARNKKNQNAYFSLSIVISLLLNIIMFIVYLVYNNSFGSLTLNQVFLLATFSIALSIFNCAERVFIGLEKVNQLAIANVGHSIFWLICVLILKNYLVNVESLFLLYLIIYFFKTLFFSSSSIL